MQAGRPSLAAPTCIGYLIAGTFSMAVAPEDLATLYVPLAPMFPFNLFCLHSPLDGCRAVEANLTDVRMACSAEVGRGSQSAQIRID